MNRRRETRWMVVAVGLGLAGCVQEVRLFDASLAVTEAEAVAGALDDADLTVFFEAISDTGFQNGSSSDEPVVGFDVDARSVSFEVAVRQAPPALTLHAFGRTGFVDVGDTGASLTVPVLLAPANTVGRLTSNPPALGGDACIADDGTGLVFLAGGSSSEQGTYVLGADFVVAGLAAGFPTGVADVGCAAGFGRLAVVGGCGAGASGTITAIDVDGNRTTTVAPITELCGAAAAPRDDGDFWVIDGSNALRIIGADGGIVSTISGARAGTRRGFELTADGAIVTIIDDELHYGTDDNDLTLGPSVALGRRGTTVLTIDAQGAVDVVENATTRPLRTVGAVDVISFVVLDDDTFVGLRADGAIIDVVNEDGSRSALPTNAAGSTRVMALPGGTIVIGGANVAGLQVVAFSQ